MGACEATSGTCPRRKGGVFGSYLGPTREVWGVRVARASGERFRGQGGQARTRASGSELPLRISYVPWVGREAPTPHENPPRITALPTHDQPIGHAHAASAMRPSLRPTLALETRVAAALPRRSRARFSAGALRPDAVGPRRPGAAWQSRLARPPGRRFPMLGSKRAKSAGLAGDARCSCGSGRRAAPNSAGPDCAPARG